jgi:hypothetical protein
MCQKWRKTATAAAAALCWTGPVLVGLASSQRGQHMSVEQSRQRHVGSTDSHDGSSNDTLVEAAQKHPRRQLTKSLSKHGQEHEQQVT